MYDADDIEAINFEQLATATDRLLLRGAVAHRGRRGRHAAPPVARDLYPRMVSFEPTARGSQPRITPPTAPVARGSQPLMTPPGEPTLQMRAQPSSLRTQVFAVTVVIPTLVGIAVGLAALL